MANELQPDTTGQWYDYYLSDWVKIDTIKKGEKAIKAAGTLYLPKLSGQDTNEYKAYLQRGSFFNAFSRTIVGLTGAIMQKPPQIKAGEEMLEMLKDITLSGESIQEVIRVVIQNILEFGYYGILVDAPVESTSDLVPYFALYPAASILNFRTVQEGSVNKLIMIALKEEIIGVNPANQFEEVIKDSVRVLSIEDGGLVVRIYEKDKVGEADVWEQIGEDILPVIKGARVQEIPFVFFGAISNSPVPDQPPLSDLANLNIKHWQVSVDYYHGLHYCAIPTPWAAGFPATAELYIGAMKAWVSEEPTATAGYLEFTGQGLGAIKQALEALEARMAVLGARMLEEQKKMAEAAATVAMRYSGDTATLSNIVNSVEQGLIKAIDFLNMWAGKTEQVEVTLNREFVSSKISAQEVTALLQSYQGQTLSLDSFLLNLQKGGVKLAGGDVETEKSKIKASPPMLPAGGNQPL